MKDCPPELLLGDINRRLSTEVTPAAIAQNNRTFVEKLLKVRATESSRAAASVAENENSEHIGSACSIKTLASSRLDS